MSQTVEDTHELTDHATVDRSVGDRETRVAGRKQPVMTYEVVGVSNSPCSAFYRARRGVGIPYA
jgi:hypothetical protein